MLRPINPHVFIYSQQGAAAVRTKTTGWLIQAVNKIGMLELVRFNSNGDTKSPVTLYLTDNGWKMMKNNSETIPALSADVNRLIPMYAVQLVGLIQHEFPELTLSNLLRPEPAQQSTFNIYAEYNFDNLDPAVFPQNDVRCETSLMRMNPKNVAVKNIPVTKPVSNLARPSTLFFSRNLEVEPVAVSTVEVEKTLGITWTELNVVRPYHVTELQMCVQNSLCLPINDTQYNQLTEELERNRQKIGVSYSCDEVGYIVVAMQDIPPHTLLTTYAGCMRPRSDVHLGDYAKSRYAITYSGKDSETPFVIDGKDYRNFGALFPHLPCRETLSRYAFNVNLMDKKPGTNQPDVAAANLTLLKYTYNFLPFAIFKTTDAVKKGDVLGHDYSEEYWQVLGITPSLFNTKGKLLDKKLYQARKITVNVTNKTKQMKLCVEDTLGNYIDHFSKNDGYYIVRLGDIKMAICGNEFLLKYKNNPRCLFMDVEDSLDVYEAALKNSRICKK